MADKIKILLTGATGYLGGSILSRFLARPDFSSLDVRVIVRSPEKAKKLEDLGFKSILGSHTDEAVMVNAVSDVDIVIAVADGDSVPAVGLTLKGLKKHFEETGKKPFYVHTSGTAIYMEFVNGMKSESIVYDDADPDQIETISPTQLHRDVDLLILAAEKEGYFKSCLVLPSTVWGEASGPLFDAGLSNPHSIQIPLFIKTSIARRRGAMIGEGKNIWPNVEIHEVADFYNLLVDKCIETADQIAHGREGIYNLTNGEHNHYELAENIGKALVALKLTDDPTPSTLTPEEEKKYYGPFAPVLGSNCRCVATRAKVLGWQPKKTTADMLGSIKAEVEALIKDGKAGL